MQKTLLVPLLLVLASPFAYGFRPLTEVLSPVGDFKIAKPVALAKTLKTAVTGWAQENKWKQDETYQQVQAYLEYRHNPKSKKAFLENCAHVVIAQKKESPLCQLELDKMERKEAQTQKPARDNLKNFRQAVATAQIEELKNTSYNGMIRGLSPLNSSDLEKLVKTLKNTSSCTDESLTAATAEKLEEFFPDPHAIADAQTLYAQAIRCGDGYPSLKSRYRLSLIQIWQNRCDNVESYLSAVTTRPEARMLRTRAKFWRHHCAEQKGQKQLAFELKNDLWNNHLLSFHNLALHNDDPRWQELLTMPRELSVRFRSLVRPEWNAQIRTIEALFALNQPEIAGEVTEAWAAKMTELEPEVRLYMAVLMNRHRQSLAQFRILSGLLEDAPHFTNIHTLKMMFPNSYFSTVKSTAKQVDPYLVMALIRQESAFNPRARSGVGARGLMQVMPATARTIASVSTPSLYKPEVNIQIGVRYLTKRLVQLEGNVEYTLAAYNAGIARIDKWSKRYPIENKVLFSDMIPFRETRDYVATILRNYFWYIKLYSDTQQEISHTPRTEIPSDAT